MCKGGGGSTETVTQNSAPPQYIQDAQKALLSRATTTSQAPLQQYTGEMVAGFTPAQLQSFDTINNAQGVAQPYYNTAQQYASQAAQPITTEQYNADSLQKYMSPYTQNVIDTTMANIQKNNAVDQNALLGKAIANGNAFGGDRAGVAAAELARNQELAANQTIAGLQNSGFTNAQQALQGQQNLQLQTGSANAGNAANAAYTFGNLGTQAQSSALAGASAQLQAGALQQQLAQEKLNVPYQQFQAQQSYPFETANFLGNLVGSSAAGAGGTSSTTQPGASTASQLGGLGMTGLGVIGGTGGFGQGGWLTSMFADGGRVPRFANGGVADQPDDISIAMLPAIPDAGKSPVPGDKIAVHGSSIPSAPPQIASASGGSGGMGGFPGMSEFSQGKQLGSIMGKGSGASGSTGVTAGNGVAHTGSAMGADAGGGGWFSGLGNIFGGGSSAAGAGGASGASSAAGGGASAYSSLASFWPAAVVAAVVGNEMYQNNTGNRDSEAFPLEWGLEGRAFYKDKDVWAKKADKILPGWGDDINIAGSLSSPADMFRGSTYSDLWHSLKKGGLLGGLLKKIFADGGRVAHHADGGAVSGLGAPAVHSIYGRYNGMNEDTLRQMAMSMPVNSPQAQVIRQVLANKSIENSDQSGFAPANDNPPEYAFGGQVDPTATDAQAATPNRFFPMMPSAAPRFDNQGHRYIDPFGMGDGPHGRGYVKIRARMASGGAFDDDDPYANDGEESDSPDVNTTEIDDDAAEYAPEQPQVQQPAQSGLGGFMDSPWAALTAAGLATMGGKSPNAFANISQGGLQGLQYLQQQRKAQQELGYKQQMLGLTKDKAEAARKHYENLDSKPIIDHSGQTTRVYYPSEGKWVDTGLPTTGAMRAKEAADYHKDALALRAQEADKGRYTMTPGLGDDGAGKQIPGVYMLNAATGETTFRPGIQLAAKGAAANEPTLTPENLDLFSDQILAGDNSPFQNLGRGAQGAANVVALRNAVADKARKKGMSGEEIAATNAEYFGTKAGERTLGTRTANIDMAVTEAQQLAPLALDASKAISRTGFIPLTKAVQALQRGANNPDLRRFVAANTSFINVYARAISPTGVPTVSGTEHARDMLSTAFDQPSYEAVVDQMMKEMKAAQSAPGHVRNSFRNAIVGDKSVAPDTAMPVVQSDDDYNALPSGTLFIDPQGAKRRKP